VPRFESPVDMTGSKIVNLADPADPQDAATKAYVDASAGGGGDVSGPASSADNAIARFDGTTGKLIQNSTATVSDAGVIGAAAAAVTEYVDVVLPAGTPANPAANTLRVYVVAGTGLVAKDSAGAVAPLTHPNQSANRVFAGPTSGGAALPAFRALVAADLPTFVGAGGSAAKGAVPSPGATAHPNQEYVLLEDATWGKNLGGYLGSSYVSTNQTTASATATDLATTQHISFTLDEAADVLIQASCVTYNPTSAAVNTMYVDVDGADTGAAYEMYGSNKFVHMVLQITASLAAGAHTVKLQFGTNAGTGNFQLRGIVIWRVS
jgi:hypothetical protein